MRLRSFILSPIFPVLLGIILFVIYTIYTTPVFLCEDNSWTLYELKSQLTSEAAKFRVAQINIEQYTDLEEQLRSVSLPNYRNFSLEEFYTNKIQSWRTEYNQAITKIHQIEACIKQIDPNFKTPISYNYYPRVGRGY